MIKAYEKYKHTKNTWYTKVPSQWLLSKVKYIAKTIAGGTPSTDKSEYWENGDIPWLPSGKLQNCDITTAEKFITEQGFNNSSTKWIKPNTTLIALTGATCANIGFLKFQACANQSVVAIDEFPDKADSRFLFYMFLSMRNQILTYQSGGAQAGINDGNVKNLYLVVPPLNEQTKIAQYLDHHTAIIDQLILQKEKLIELLKEKRQVVINEAVTKGLNSNANMKDSKIEWLGEIPEQWEVKKVKYLLSENEGIKIGPFGSALKLDMMVDSGYKVYGQENVINNDFETGKRFITEAKYEEMANYKLFPGDIIITMMGTTGKCKVLPEGVAEGIMDSHLIRLRLNKGIFPEFFALLINDSDYIKQQIDEVSKGAIMTGLNSTIIKTLLIILPDSRKKQEELLIEIKNKLILIETLSNNLILQVEKLKEYRQSIISEAVTGKIDVRDWQPNKKQMA
jgi:type I restriction enzyme S subunit